MSKGQLNLTPLSIKPLNEEEKWRIFYVSSVNKDNVKDYIQDLHGPRQRKLIALLKKIADSPRMRNDEKYKNLGDGVFEIKTDIVRIYCFEDEEKIICTHARNKPGRKMVLNDKKKVIYYRKQYFIEQETTT